VGRIASQVLAATAIASFTPSNAVFAQALQLQPEAFIAASSSVVRVEADREHGGLAIGSGVTVAPSIVVTNCHVTRDASSIRIAGGGNVWLATAQYADGARDLCFLRAPNWKGQPARFGEREALQVGEPVAAIGFTGGTGRSLRFGHVQALHVLDGARVIESDTAFTSGASGGGLFDESGALVGLLTFRMRGTTGSYYSLPVRWIRDELPTESQWTDIRPLPEAMPFWQRDAETLPFFMRAAPLSAEGRWVELIDLTRRWSAVDPRDAEALIVRGEAMQKLDRPQAAIRAFVQAVTLGPEVPSAWYGLALAYASVGDDVAAQRAGSRLAALDPALAEQLRDAVEQLRVAP